MRAIHSAASSAEKCLRFVLLAQVCPRSKNEFLFQLVYCRRPQEGLYLRGQVNVSEQ